MMDYVSLRKSLGLTEEEAAQRVAMRSWARGAIAASDAVLQATKCGSLQEALVGREKFVVPDAAEMLVSEEEIPRA